MAAPGTEIVVIGGGVIGLAITRSLRQAGARVILLEQGPIGAQSSAAAAGMLAPLAEAHRPGPLTDLGLRSLERYPAFVAELQEETGIDSELIGPGMLRLASSASEQQALERDFVWQREAGLPVERLSGSEARQLEPDIGPDICAAVLSGRERQVEPRRLTRALERACVLADARLLSHTPAIGWETSGERITGVRTTQETIPCLRAILCAGAWTEALTALLSARLPITPVRGQMAVLTPERPAIRHTLYTPQGYLVPKADGRILIGSTEERCGFAAHVTVAGLAALLALATGVAPRLAGTPFTHAWAGLRPGTPDGLPVLGPLPGWSNVYAATGHFRNGILLAPITAEIVAQELLEETPYPLARFFRADRFAC